jgi:hypothetical protein
VTPAQITNALDLATAHAKATGRSNVLRVVTTRGTIIDAPEAHMLRGMLRIVDMNRDGRITSADSLTG